MTREQIQARRAEILGQIAELQERSEELERQYEMLPEVREERARKYEALPEYKRKQIEFCNEMLMRIDSNSPKFADLA